MHTFTNETLSVPAITTALYTCPAATVAVVNSLFIANTHATNATTVDLFLFDQSKGTEFIMVNAFPIEANDTLIFDKPINLLAGDVLRIRCPVANEVHATCSILEQT